MEFGFEAVCGGDAGGSHWVGQGVPGQGGGVPYTFSGEFGECAVYGYFPIWFWGGDGCAGGQL